MKAITIWVTESCNMRCKYCYEGSDKRHIKISDKKVHALIGFIKNEINKSISNELIVSFHGGEPLIEVGLIKKIVGVIDNVAIENRIKIFYELTTNGSINQDEFIEFIENRNDFQVSVSIDGMKETNDLNRVTVRGESTFETALMFAHSLKDRGINPRIRMTITPETSERIYDNISFFVEQGFNMIVAIPNFFDKGWSYEVLNNFEKEILKLYKKYGNSKRELHISLLENFYSLKEIGICTGGKDEIHISAEGYLFPCTYTMNNFKYCVGDINTGIDAEKLVKIQKMYLEKNNDCIGCTANKVCDSSRCKFLNEVMTGKYNKPSPIICWLTGMKVRFYRNENANRK